MISVYSCNQFFNIKELPFKVNVTVLLGELMDNSRAAPVVNKMLAMLDQKTGAHWVTNEIGSDIELI